MMWKLRVAFCLLMISRYRTCYMLLGTSNNLGEQPLLHPSTHAKVTYGNTLQAQRQENGDLSVTSLDDSDVLQILVVPTFVESNRNLSILRRELYTYAVQNTWHRAKVIYDEFNDMVRIPLTTNGDTALHVAVSLNNHTFMRGFVKLEYVTPEDLEIPNDEKNTAFCVAAITGNRYCSEIMSDKNEKLPLIPGHDGMLPVHLAALHGNHTTVKALSSENLLLKMDFKHIEKLFFMTIDSSMYDVAMELVDKYSEKLVVARRDDKQTALHMLMRKPSESGDSYRRYYYVRVPLINCTFKFNVGWRRSDMHGNNDKKRWGSRFTLVKQLWFHVQQLEHKKRVELITNPSVILFDALESSNFAEVEWLLYVNRDLLTIKDSENGRNILHVAALCQYPSFIGFILQMETSKLIIREVDKDHNNVLHLAACRPKRKYKKILSPNKRMQRETVYFKGLEKRLPHELTAMRNKDGMTPIELLYANHEDISKEVTEFATTVAKSGMLVATLVATIAFAAALTVPGDKSSMWFVVFISTNAFALFTSAAAIVIFLIIFMRSRVTSETIGSLQEMLFDGPTLLFASIISMVVAFDAASFLIFEHKHKVVPYVVILLGLIPVIPLRKVRFILQDKVGRPVKIKKQKYKKW